MKLENLMKVIDTANTVIEVHLKMFDNIERIQIEACDYNPQTMAYFDVISIESDDSTVIVVCESPTSKGQQIKVKYFGDTPELTVIEKGDWIDLCTRELVELKKGDFCIIPLGVAMELPKGYTAYVLPRSSTFKRYGILMANSVGVIDGSYCGDNDEWGFPAYATQDVVIPKHTRIAQFSVKKQVRNLHLELLTI